MELNIDVLQQLPADEDEQGLCGYTCSSNFGGSTCTWTGVAS